MILTESDLHAYNRGELPPDAVRQLEDDPLAMQDAARLRAISAAIRAEEPIPVTGRAETLERLRRKSRSRIGVSPWVWATGAACVVGLVFISVPRESRPEFQVRWASHTQEKSSTSASPMAEANAVTAPRPDRAGTSAADASSTREVSPAAAEAPAAAPAVAAGPKPASPVARTSTLVILVSDISRAQASAIAEARKMGGRVLAASSSRQESSLQISIAPRVERTFLARLARLGTVEGEAQMQAGVTAPKNGVEQRDLTTAQDTTLSRPADLKRKQPQATRLKRLRIVFRQSEGTAP